MIVLEKLEDLKKYYNAEKNSYKFQESIQIKFDLKIEAFLIVEGDIDARDIHARDIDARNIHAMDIHAWDIDARDIHARNIDALDIDARDIDAMDIDARDIDARDIEYYAFAVAYSSFKCVSETARRKNGIAVCLDQPIFYKDKENK